MQKDWLDYSVAVVQMFSLFFLSIYVVKTWHIANETKKATEIEDFRL